MKYHYFISSAFVAIVCLVGHRVNATIHHVGVARAYSSLTAAIQETNAGDTIMIHNGQYEGDISITALSGEIKKWIYIIAAPSETVVFKGGVTAWHLTDVSYLVMRGIIFQQQTGNGVNIDDGGSYETPSHHIILDSCIFRDIAATGNNDLLKMSGVDYFEIRNCIFLNGAPGGSGIDMVGCHNGVVINNRFEKQGANSLQMKGGSSDIKVERNVFKNGGQRSVNMGGATGVSLFRPMNVNYEAARLSVYSNIFIGSDAPIAFVGCIDSDVSNNTIYLPEKWVLRILQENTDTLRFRKCGNNSFANNIIYHDNKVKADCNVGPHTHAASFRFIGNVWYYSENKSWQGPELPVKEHKGIINKKPEFINPAEENFQLKNPKNIRDKGYIYSGKM